MKALLHSQTKRNRTPKLLLRGNAMKKLSQLAPFKKKKLKEKSRSTLIEWSKTLTKEDNLGTTGLRFEN